MRLLWSRAHGTVIKGGGGRGCDGGRVVSMHTMKTFAGGAQRMEEGPCRCGMGVALKLEARQAR